MFALSDVTFDNDIVFKLKKSFSIFDVIFSIPLESKVRVFVDKDLDFTFLEFVDYSLNITSSSHKLMDTISSPYTYLLVSYSSFRNHLNNI